MDEGRTIGGEDEGYNELIGRKEDLQRSIAVVVVVSNSSLRFDTNSLY